jgi:ribosomal protein S18 acetylase RimI-like enzyme
MIVVRKAAKSDARVLSELATETYAVAFGHSFSAGDLTAEMRANLTEACFERYIDDDIVLIGDIDGRVVGYVQFGAVGTPVGTESGSDREVRRLYVHPDCQRRGIGKRLMDAAFGHPELRSARDVYLDVWERNEGALRFYKRYGFEVIGARRFDVASGAATDPDLIMVRRLSGPRRPARPRRS